MKQLFTITVVLAGGWCLLGASAAGQPLSTDRRPDGPVARWPVERVELLDGRRYEGFIESEDDAWVNLIQIRRPPGKPMHLVIRPLARPSIAAVVRLKPAQRAQLRKRIEQFINRSRIEAGRMEAVVLKPIEKEGKQYQQYRGKWFTLASTAGEATTRRMIVRIEQIFTAYRQILAPRAQSRPPGRSLRIVVLGSTEEYQAYLRKLGIKIKNRACFVQKDNLVVAGSELARYTAAMVRIKAQHDRLRAELKRLEKELSKRLAELARQLKKQHVPRKEIARLLWMERRKFDDEIEKKRRELKVCDRKNARAFDAVTRAMFVRLYHEAFHAYLENYVYPHQGHDVPLWLNEGLAMVFEGGLLESETLRIDAPNRAALERLKAELRDGQPLPLRELLSAGRSAFLLAHGDSSSTSDRHYAYSWGLAYYLTFERQLLGSPALGRYVKQTAENASPVERFEDLADMPLARFEKAWREYILTLR